MKISALARLFVMALLLVACRKQPAATFTPFAPSEVDRLIAAAQAEGQLNVIALPHDWMNYGEVISAFSQKYGIAVNERDPDAGSFDELDAIRNSKTDGEKPAPDVVDVSIPVAIQAANENLLQPYKVSTWSSIPDWAKDASGSWYGDYYGIIVFEVNTKFVSTIPQDWTDLLESKYKISMRGFGNPPSYLTLMPIYSASLAQGGSMNDTTPGLLFFQQIQQSGRLSRFDDDALESGETPVALLLDYLALANLKEHSADSGITIIVPKSGNVAMPFAQGISAYAPHPNAAKLWMEFLYSDEGQLLLLKGLGRPIRFADLLQRNVIPNDLIQGMLPSDLYLQTVFPTGEQINAAFQSMVANWNSYMP